MSEPTTDIVEALQQLVKAQLLDTNTALPGTVVTYSNGLATVQPNPNKQFADGDILKYPIVPDVRVCWPAFNGGKAGCKGPVKPGDQCLLVFSQQAIDDPEDRRMFDLTDAYAVMVDLGRPVGAGDSANNEDMTMWHGAAYMRITEDGHIYINAPDGMDITAPLTTVHGKMTVEDLFTYLNGMIGQTTAGTSATISGNIIHDSGSITSLGRTIDGTHTHPGDSGGTTGIPNV